MRLSIPLIAFSLAILTACDPTRRVATSVTEVSDTTHVVVHDTVRITQVHDSIVFHAVEHTHEEETTTYDPLTGHPVQHQVIRDIDRDIDALIRHIADSVLSAHSVDSTGLFIASSSDTDETERVPPSLSVWQRFAQKASSLFFLLLVIILIVFAVRLYLRHGDAVGK